MLKEIAKSFGGRYQPNYRNWVLPVGVKAALLSQLERIGAVRKANCCQGDARLWPETLNCRRDANPATVTRSPASVTSPARSAADHRCWAC